MAVRTYRNDQIIVNWNSERCAHAAFCLRTLPEVFDFDARPWVDVTAATADEIAAAIEKCPSGALAYERIDGAPQEVPTDPPTIVPWPNGPLFVRGTIEIRDRQGDRYETGPRLALCRCGQSRNHPFCDASHRAAGFTSNPRAISEQRKKAESPADLAHGTGS